jgi:hypothetical protein
MALPPIDKAASNARASQIRKIVDSGKHSYISKKL